MAGMVIFFCDQCGLRIPQKDFITGKARKAEETKALCAQCASGGEAAPADGAKSHRSLRDSKPGVRPAGRQTPGQGGERKSGPAVRDLKLGITPATREAGAVARAGKAHLAAPAAPSSTSRNLVFAGVGVVAVFGVLLAVLLSGKLGAAPREKARHSTAESPSVPRPAAPTRSQPASGRTETPPTSETYDPRASVAASLLLQAKQYQASRPDDPWGYREKLEQLKTGYARTPAGDEAARLLADLKLSEKTATPAPALGPVEGQERVQTKAVIVPQGPRIDGKLEDPAWQKAPPLTLGKVPGMGKAELAATARVLFDDKFLYVGFDCSEPDTASLKKEVGERDGKVWDDDCVEVFVLADPDLGYRHIIVNAAGTVMDENCAGGKHDASWNGDIKAAVAVEEGKRWTATLSVPLKDLGAYVGENLSWRMNLTRMRPARRGAGVQESSWAILPTMSFHQPAAFGQLDGVSIPEREGGVARKRDKPP